MVTERRFVIITEVIEAPADWLGTLPEFLVYRELMRLGVEFDYQSSQLGGRLERGGSVLDFFIPTRNLGLNVMSTYWHYGRPEGSRNDRLQREQLEAIGIMVVYLDEEDLYRNARFYVMEAIQGRDHSRMAIR